MPERREDKTKRENSIYRRLNSDKCVACSSCVIQCPVSKATSRFLGPKLTGPALERFRLADLPDTEWLEYCSNCKNCDISCPLGVSVSLLNMAARGEYFKIRRPPMRDWVLAHGRTLSRLVEIMPNFLVKFGMTNPATRFILDLFGVDKRAPLPVFAKTYFPRNFKKLRQPLSPRKAVIFPGCYVDVYDPRTGLDIVSVLNEGGYEVVHPEGLSCCGLPMIANGFMEDSEKNARINYCILKKYRDEGVPIIAPCPSCVLTLNREYAEMFPWVITDGPLNVQDACEFVLGLMDSGELRGSMVSPIRSKVIYHEPCHLRAQGIGKPGLRLLRRIEGIETVDSNAICCGISGSYGFKKGKYEISMNVGSGLFEKAASSGASSAASECGTCRLQITHGAGIEALHPLTLIKKYYLS